MFWANQNGRGAHVNVSGAGVTKYADDPKLARHLIEWLATSGQQVFISTSHEVPTNPAATASDPVKALGPYKGDTIQAAKVGELNADTTKLMAEVGYE